MLKTPALLCAATAILAFVAICASCSAQPYIYVTYFDAIPSPIAAGQQATLHWNVTGADTVVIDTGIGKVPPYGKATISPLQTTTYTLTARNATRTVTATAKLEIATTARSNTQSAPVTSKTPLAPVILTYSPIDTDTLLKHEGDEVEVKGKVTLVKRWPEGFSTDAWTSIYFTEDAATASFPGSTANADPLDYTSYFRAIIKPPYYWVFYPQYGWCAAQAGDNVTIRGTLEVLKSAPVIYLKTKGQLTVTK